MVNIKVCLAEQDFNFPYFIPELEPFATNRSDDESLPSFPDTKFVALIACIVSFVGGRDRQVEVRSASAGFLLKVEGGGEFFIASHGEVIGKQNPQEELSQLDREIILGPALVLALALRGVWSLHASAAMYKENVIVFLGESGQGKSTLAAYLSQSAGWHLVADDILPVKIDPSGVSVLPHFPQLKLPVDAQPGVHLPEQLPLRIICLLEQAEADRMPELQKFSTAQTVQMLLSHIAGTRMFTTDLLKQHLEFSTQAAKQVSAFRLINPHRRDTFPLVREFLEKIC